MNTKKWYEMSTVEHLERYITNRNARTGKTWTVIVRYATDGDRHRVDVNAPRACWQRACIENEHGDRVRIYHYGSCWRVAR